jgi:DNA-binding Lrp family transcriptional regulator
MTEQEPRKTNKKYKTVDRDLVFRLACIQCSDQEIAEVVGVSVDTLRRRFSKILEQGKQEGRQSLRRAMYEKAMNGDSRLQIFLSKQYLGMRDTPEDGDAKAPLPWED